MTDPPNRPPTGNASDPAPREPGPAAKAARAPEVVAPAAEPATASATEPASVPAPTAGELTPWRRKLHDIIFESDTPAGRWFDLGLILMILASVIVVSLETVSGFAAKSVFGTTFTYGELFRVLEWVFTVAFTVEFVLRLLCVRKPSAYALSFFGVVDVLSILPTYLAFFFPQAQSLLVIRILRLLRVFRVLKLAHLVRESTQLRRAVWDSRGKIVVFIATVLSMVSILGALMYLIESGPNPAFSSIPQSMYWAIVTMTTVGYGDIAPVTPLGKLLSAAIMVLGYSMIIVPTGILSAELSSGPKRLTGQSCPSCMREGQPPGARFCFHCGDPL